MFNRSTVTVLIVASMATSISVLGFECTFAADPAKDSLNMVAAFSTKESPKKYFARSGPKIPVMVEGQVFVKYREPPLPVPLPERAAEMEQLAKRLSAPYFPLEIRFTYLRLGIHLFKIPPGMSVSDAIKRLSMDPAVEIAAPNYKVFPLATPPPPPPYDPAWINGDEWGMALIGMGQVWNTGYVGGNVVVAVIDSGIDTTPHRDFIHSDSSTNLWRASDGSYGANYCDNGFPANAPVDDMGHGTLVAGIIGAVGSAVTTGAQDVAGVNWNIKMMAVKTLCEDGSEDAGTHINGIEYAVDNGAAIINASWTIGNVDDPMLRYAVQDAHDHNILFVAAAGNEKNDNDAHPQYPASYQLDNVITVAATNAADMLWADAFNSAQGSNYGAISVHIAAPGDWHISLWPHDLDPFLYTGYLDGTSMAAPFVAGCAALLQAYRLANGLPPLLPAQLKTALMNTGEYKSLPINGGRRLNCKQAIYPFDSTPPAIPKGLTVR